MEVAGVVLGAVPIILFALDNYARVWDPIQKTWRWEETVLTIKNQIFLQKQQLDTTLRSLGLEDPTLAQVEYKLEIHHPHQCRQFMDIIRKMDDLINDISRNLYPDAEGPPSWKYANSPRLQWDWRRVKRGFRSRKRKEIIEQLQSWNIALKNCGLEKREIPAGSQNRIINLIRERFDDAETKAVRANANALHKAIGSGLGCRCNNVHKGNIQLNWHENKPRTASAFYMAFSTNAAGQGPSSASNDSWKTMSMVIEEAESDPIAALSIPPPILPSTAPSPPATAVPPTIPQQQKTKSWRVLGFNITRERSPRAKSRSSTANPPPVSQTSLIPMPVAPRSPSPVSSMKLCNILRSTPTADTLLGCLPIPGSDPCKQLRVVSKVADNGTSAPTKRATQLHSLLYRTIDGTTNRKLALTRKQRFGVAAALTWAALHLANSPWLAKSLNNEEIHMFLEGQSGATTSNISRHPYISYDFYSAKSNPGHLEPAPQPTLQFDANQVPNLFFFTLGIRLIELGRNLPFVKICEEYNTSLASTSSPNPPPTAINDFEVAKAQYDELCLDPGRAYADAVDRCLKFLFPGNAAMHTFEHREFRTSFFEDVVAPVQATFELIPGSYAELFG